MCGCVRNVGVCICKGVWMVVGMCVYVCEKSFSILFFNQTLRTVETRARTTEGKLTDTLQQLQAQGDQAKYVYDCV